MVYRCLIVEDNPVHYTILQNQMIKLGLAVTVCVNGAEALDYCHRHVLPELIVLDGYMPQMDGITFLKKLRAMPNGLRPFVLFCSSSLDCISVDEALAEGADCHYPKPIAQEQLHHVMQQLSERFDPPASQLAGEH